MSDLKVTNIQHASATSPNITLGSDGSVAVGGGNISPQTGFRNRIINGDMRIDQRNAGASVTSSGGAGANWAVDRFQANVAGTSAVVTAQRVSDAPSGFINSLKITVTTAATATAAQFTFVRQIIEGLNISDLGWGTADAQPVTLSFWVKASITGTYSAFAINHAEDRSYVGTFAVNAANTWEYKTITVPGDTTGTWLTTNSNGIRLGFDLGSGSNFQGTGNAWNSGWRQRTSSTVNFIGTNGATFYITGVQLEKGSVATPFEFRSIGQELALCQRYYEKGGGVTMGAGYTSTYPQFWYKTTKRATPTVTNSRSVAAATGPDGVSHWYQDGADTAPYAFSWTASSEL